MRSHGEIALGLDPARVWTDITGRSLEGVLVAVEGDDALIRVLKNQRVYRIPLHRLSEADRSYLTETDHASEDNGFYPPVPSRWPVMLGGASGAPPIKPMSNGKGWQSANFDYLSSDTVDASLIRELAHTCETLHGLAAQTPLPIGWGRPHDTRRQVHIYPTGREFAQTGAQKNWAAFYNPADNSVHFPLTALGVGAAAGAEYDATRRKSFKVLIHELAHQESVSLLVLDCPAWCGEGIAELFSAMQRAPGVFVFNNPQLSVKRQFLHLIGLGHGIKLKRLSVPNIDSFLNISLANFNRYAAESPGKGASYYTGSLLLVDYFCFADGNSMRPYMEAILTGVSPSKAAEIHLLRGRSPAEIETDIVARWKAQGVQVQFSESPTVKLSDIEAQVGFTLDLPGGN